MLKSLLKKITLLIFDKPVRYVISQMYIYAPIEKRFQDIEIMLQDSYPEEWIINERSETEINKIKNLFNLPSNFDTGISKNDLMFRFFLQNNFTFPNAFKAYFVRSIHFLDLVSKIAEKKWGKEWAKNTTPFLDFASGYGAFERLLIHYLPADQIYTSDIKAKGVDFQVKKFGVNGIYSSYIPEDFQPSVKFKFIYVASLFSHLPEDLFYRWLKVLYGCLDKDGILAFTVHDVSIINSEKDTNYFTTSEDTFSKVVEDAITRQESYGNMYVSEKHVSEQLLKLGISKNQYFRYKKAFCGLQDIYVVSNEVNLFDDSVKFNYYDSTKY